MNGTSKIPKEILYYAQRYCRFVPGDRPSLAGSQWALETGWGESPKLGGRLWREHFNGGAIKVAEDARFQAGALEGHATYQDIEHYFLDRRRILTFYHHDAREAGEDAWNMVGLLDKHWAPAQDYGDELLRIIRENELWRLDPAPSR